MSRNRVVEIQPTFKHITHIRLMCDCRYSPSVTIKILAAQYLALVPLWLQRDFDDTDPGQTKLKYFNVCVSRKEPTRSFLWLDVTLHKDECAMQDFTAACHTFLGVRTPKRLDSYHSLDTPQTPCSSCKLPHMYELTLVKVSSWQMYVILYIIVLHVVEGRCPGVHCTIPPFLTCCGTLVTCWYHWRLYCVFTGQLHSNSLPLRKVWTDIGGVSLLSGTTRRGKHEVQLCIQHVPSLLQRTHVLIQILWRPARSSLTVNYAFCCHATSPVQWLGSSTLICFLRLPPTASIN